MPYSEVTVTGYNANPPDDDGSQTSDNEVTWAKHKTKLGDPLKTALDSTQTNISTIVTTLEAQLTAVEAVTEDPVIVGLATLTPDGNDIPLLGPSAVASTVAFLDEDDMASASATGVPSQQSTKAYTDNRTGDWAHYQHQSATDGATHAADSWVKRLLATEVYDSIGASIATNVVTIPAGTYVCWFSAACYFHEEDLPQNIAPAVTIRLRDTTNNATLGRGHGTGGTSQTTATDRFSQRMWAAGQCIFTVAGSTNLELQTFLDAEGQTLDTRTHGKAFGTGEDNVYADLMLWKIG